MGRRVPFFDFPVADRRQLAGDEKEKGKKKKKKKSSPVLLNFVLSLSIALCLQTRGVSLIASTGWSREKSHRMSGSELSHERDIFDSSSIGSRSR
jgi:hypothetical protein